MVLNRGFSRDCSCGKTIWNIGFQIGVQIGVPIGFLIGCDGIYSQHYPTISFGCV